MRRVAMWAGLGCVLVLSGARAQMPASQAGPLPMPSGSRLADEGKPPQDATMARLQEQQSKSWNQNRQKKLEEDTAKLYALASELKDEVGKTNKDTLSVDVIKKADEIERLAHSVKEKMKG